MKSYDVIIAGARCAGASTACFLAEQGYRVLLIEAYQAPGPTLSTHIIGETDIYDRLGLTGKFQAAKIPEMTRMRVDLDGRVMESAICVTTRALSVRRELLDSWLLERAGSYPDVDILLGTKLVEMEIVEGEAEEDCSVKITGHNEQGEKILAQAKVVVGADGRHSTVSELANAPMERESDKDHLAVIYAYFKGLLPLPIPTVEWYWTYPGLMLCNPLDNGLHCIAWMTPQAQFNPQRKDLKAYLLQSLARIETLAPRLTHSEITGRVKGVPAKASYIRQPYGDGWVLVGDASAYLHPVSGSGIDNAICMAEQLAAQLHLYLRGDLSWQQAMASYKQHRDERIIPQYDACLQTLSRAGEQLEEDQLQALDWLLTFPSLSKSLTGQAASIYHNLTGGHTHAGMPQ
ncbi:NAD(P)/FAD-dependent oxidoreductase [Marinicrinis sediminis]|uniref:NAD(P)/FAD-dependent oxidoreductase n=1 Tax=Marinicrinis sediminis TaxID=1652465 RepID=A0ABW5RFG1_9BACL